MLFENNQWFDEIFDAIYRFTMILDGRGRVLRANQAALDIIGQSQEKVIGHLLWGLYWPTLPRQYKKILKRSVNQAFQGQFVQHELEIRPRKGESKILEFSLKPFLDKDGLLRFILAEGRDISAYKRTFEALFQSEERFKSIFEKSAMGVLITGVNGKILDCNPAFQSMLGYSSEEMVGKFYISITHPLDRGASRKLFIELITGKRPNYFLEKRFMSKEGLVVWARVTASQVVSFDKKSRFVIAMIENITIQKQIESEVSELQQRLMQGREMERLRLAQELHDGPLQDVIGVLFQLQSLSGYDQGETALEQIRTIQDSLEQLSESIRTICGELRPPTLISFGLEKAITSNIEGIKQSHPELEINLDLAEDGLRIPEQVRIALYRIYQEALNNILRHAHAQSVKITLSRTQSEVILNIEDDGIGFILPERWITLARQGHLGLVGAKERAKEVGGILVVITSPGSGTRIQASVPLDIQSFQPNGK